MFYTSTASAASDKYHVCLRGNYIGVISLCNFGHVYPVQLCIAIIMIIIHYNHHHYPK